MIDESFEQGPSPASEVRRQPCPRCGGKGIVRCHYLPLDVFLDRLCDGCNGSCAVKVEE